jgi:hypothetical protein
LDSDDRSGVECDPTADDRVRPPSQEAPPDHQAGWRVVELQEEGIAYFVVKDDTDRVQVTIGNAGGVFWAVPAAGAMAKVSLPSWRLSIPADALPTQVYGSADFSLVLFDHGGDAVWSVEFLREAAGLDARPFPRRTR